MVSNLVIHTELDNSPAPPTSTQREMVSEKKVFLDFIQLVMNEYEWLFYNVDQEHRVLVKPVLHYDFVERRKTLLARFALSGSRGEVQTARPAPCVKSEVWRVPVLNYTAPRLYIVADKHIFTK